MGVRRVLLHEMASMVIMYIKLSSSTPGGISNINKNPTKTRLRFATPYCSRTRCDEEENKNLPSPLKWYFMAHWRSSVREAVA